MASNDACAWSTVGYIFQLERTYFMLRLYPPTTGTVGEERAASPAQPPELVRVMAHSEHVDLAAAEAEMGFYQSYAPVS
jgi:hypothetical protein